MGRRDIPDFREWLLAGCLVVDAGFTSPCWAWQKEITHKGYARARLPQRFAPAARPGQRARLHRAAYVLLAGVIPEGLVIDHLCRNRACVNPAHLEPVTVAENSRRGIQYRKQNCQRTHCTRGHECTFENTYVDPKGGQHCRVCHRENMRNWTAKRARMMRAPRRHEVDQSCPHIPPLMPFHGGGVNK